MSDLGADIFHEESEPLTDEEKFVGLCTFGTALRASIDASASADLWDEYPEIEEYHDILLRMEASIRGDARTMKKALELSEGDQC